MRVLLSLQLGKAPHSTANVTSIVRSCTLLPGDVHHAGQHSPVMVAERA